MASPAASGHYSSVGGLENEVWAVVEEISSGEIFLCATRLSALRQIVGFWMSEYPQDVFIVEPAFRNGEMVGMQFVLNVGFVDLIRWAALNLSESTLNDRCQMIEQIIEDSDHRHCQ